MRYLFCLFVLLSNFALADQPKPCSSSEFRQFDFWLGEWNVMNLANEKFSGNNKITAIENECR